MASVAGADTLDKQIKDRLVHAAQPDGAVELGEACNWLYGARAPPELKDRAKARVRSAGGPKTYILRFPEFGIERRGPSTDYLVLKHPTTSLNSRGLPLRPGVAVCDYYQRNRRCSYGADCKYHRPELGSMSQATAKGIGSCGGFDDGRTTIEDELRTRLKRDLQLRDGTLLLKDAGTCLYGSLSQAETARAKKYIESCGGLDKWLRQHNWLQVDRMKMGARLEKWVGVVSLKPSAGGHVGLSAPTATAAADDGDAKDAFRKRPHHDGTASGSGDGGSSSGSGSNRDGGGGDGGASCSGSSMTPPMLTATPPPSSQTNGKAKMSAPSAANAAVAITLLPSHHISVAQAEHVANDASCTLICVSRGQPAQMKLQGTPLQLSRAARLVLLMHTSKETMFTLILVANEAEVNAIHASAPLSRGLLELKKHTRCDISIVSRSNSGGCLVRKLRIQAGGGSNDTEPVDLVVSAVQSIAELWSRLPSCGVAATPGTVSTAAQGTSVETCTGTPPHATSKRTREEIVLVSQTPVGEAELEQRRKRLARFENKNPINTAATTKFNAASAANTANAVTPSFPTTAATAATAVLKAAHASLRQTPDLSAKLSPSPGTDLSASSGGTFDSDGEKQTALWQLQEEKEALEARNRQLQVDLEAARSTHHARVIEVSQQRDRRRYEKQLLAFRSYVSILQKHAGKGAVEEWKNFVVRRELEVPSFKESDVGNSVDIEGDEQTPSQIRFGGVGVSAAKHRIVEWGIEQPPNVKGALITSVEERVGGWVTIEIPRTIDHPMCTFTFHNPKGGLVNDVLGFMEFGSSNRGFSRQDFFKPTRVHFEGENGVDAGGLTQEMFATFWRGAIGKEAGLFETADAALPSTSASEERLQLVGQFLCKSILNEVPIGRGLCPFVFEFLLDETDRSFDASLPLDEQTAMALCALRAYDNRLYEQYNTLLVAYLNGAEVPGAFTIGDLVPNCEDDKEEEPVTKENVQPVIVAACKYRLWDQREEQLLALRRGFSTDSVLSKDPIDLLVHLRPFLTPDLMLLVQGNTEPLSTFELIERCIKWPDESRAAVADNGGGFPPGSTTVALLRSLLEDESDFTADRREQFVGWVTARSVLPSAGLASTDGGVIKIRWDETPREDDEEMWPLPRVSTCFHVLHLANFSRIDVLKRKLLTAMESRRFEEA